MHNGKYTSIKSILYDISRYPFVEGIQSEDIALYLTNLLSLVGSPFAFEKKFTTPPLEIKDYKACIPCDLIRIDGTRYSLDCVSGFMPLLYASDIYHSQYHNHDCPDIGCKSDQSYSLNGNYIFTSFKEGFIEIAYQGIKTDEEGLPMIPDSVSFKNALKYYILWQYAEPARFRGEVPRDVYEEIKQQYYWYVGQASSDLNMLSLDKMKSLENGIIRLLQNHNTHSTSWQGFTNKEYLKK